MLTSLQLLLALCGSVLWCVSTGFTTFGTLLARRHFRALPPQDIHPLPPVSILKPFKGTEPRFKDATESFFKLQYRGGFELLFCVADESDVGIHIIRELIAHYPSINARLLIGQDAGFANPKAGNTEKAYVQATHDLLLISDSNVLVKPDYLDHVVPLLRADVGLVTGVVAGVDATTFAGFMEAATLNTFSARWMLIGSLAGAPIVMGKSMLFSRAQAERFGGLRTLGLYLAEDYMAGHAMLYLNKKVIIMNRPIEQIISGYDFATYWARHVRWGRLRRAQSPPAFFAEPIVSCLPIGLIGSLSFQHLSGLSFAIFMIAHLCLWFMNDFHLIGSLRAQRGWRMAAGWICKEVLYMPLWIFTLAGQTVQWRGRRLKVEHGGLLLNET